MTMIHKAPPRSYIKAKIAAAIARHTEQQQAKYLKSDMALIDHHELNRTMFPLGAQQVVDAAIDAAFEGWEEAVKEGEQ